MGEHAGTRGRHKRTRLLFPEVMLHQGCCLVVLFITAMTRPSQCSALTPEEEVVVANKMAWHSCDLAEYYMKKRGIPPGNLITLKAPAGESCSRDDYEEYIASPVRAFVQKNDPKGRHKVRSQYFQFISQPGRVSSAERHM